MSFKKVFKYEFQSAAKLVGMPALIVLVLSLAFICSLFFSFLTPVATFGIMTIIALSVLLFFIMAIPLVRFYRLYGDQGYYKLSYPVPMAYHYNAVILSAASYFFLYLLYFYGLSFLIVKLIPRFSNEISDWCRSLLTGFSVVFRYDNSLTPLQLTFIILVHLITIFSVPILASFYMIQGQSGFMSGIGPIAGPFVVFIISRIMGEILKSLKFVAPYYLVIGNKGAEIKDLNTIMGGIDRMHSPGQFVEYLSDNMFHFNILYQSIFLCLIVAIYFYSKYLFSKKFALLDN